MTKARFLSTFLAALVAAAVAWAGGASEQESREIEKLLSSLRGDCKVLAKLEKKRDEAKEEVERLEAHKEELEREMRFLNRRAVVNANRLNERHAERDRLTQEELPRAQERLAKEEDKVARKQADIDVIRAALKAFDRKALPFIDEALKDPGKNREMFSVLEDLRVEILRDAAPEKEPYRIR